MKGGAKKNIFVFKCLELHYLNVLQNRIEMNKRNRDEQKSKLKTKDIRMNISSVLLLKSKQMVWIQVVHSL